MDIKEPFMIFSVDFASNPEECNAERRVTVERQLYVRDLAFKRVEGFYQGSREVAYVVLTPADGGAQRAVLELARRYGQESVLQVDANRFATLLFLNPPGAVPDIKRYASIGFFRQISAVEAANAGNYTKDGETYYGTVLHP